MQAEEELGSTLATIGQSSVQKKNNINNQFYYHYSMISLSMYQWNLVCLAGSSLGSVTTVANMDIRLQSIGVAVKHHASTNACLTGRPCQSRVNSKKRNKKVSFN